MSANRSLLETQHDVLQQAPAGRDYTIAGPEATEKHGCDVYLGIAEVVIVDAVQGVVLYMPTKC